jgi:hypothetical protein
MDDRYSGVASSRSARRFNNTTVEVTDLGDARSVCCVSSTKLEAIGAGNSAQRVLRKQHYGRSHSLSRA